MLTESQPEEQAVSEGLVEFKNTADSQDLFCSWWAFLFLVLFLPSLFFWLLLFIWCRLSSVQLSVLFGSQFCSAQSGPASVLFGSQLQPLLSIFAPLFVSVSSPLLLRLFPFAFWYFFCAFCFSLNKTSFSSSICFLTVGPRDTHRRLSWNSNREHTWSYFLLPVSADGFCLKAFVGSVGSVRWTVIICCCLVTDHADESSCTLTNATQVLRCSLKWIVASWVTHWLRQKKKKKKSAVFITHLTRLQCPLWREIMEHDRAPRPYV